MKSRAHIRRWSIDLAVAFVVTVAVLAPVAMQYYRVRVDLQLVRSAGEIESGGADLRAYFVPDSGVWRRWLPLPKPIFGETEKELFPGIAGPMLAVIALYAAAVDRRRNSRWTIVYASIAMAGFLLSFGPLVRTWGVVLTRHGPYDWLQYLLPGMSGMRAPSRFVVVAIVGLSVLAGFGAAFLLGRIRPRVRALVIAVMLAGVIADGWAVPIKTVASQPRGRLEDRAIVEWLRAMPPGVVLHLPLMTAQFQELHYRTRRCSTAIRSSTVSPAGPRRSRSCCVNRGRRCTTTNATLPR